MVLLLCCCDGGEGTVALLAAMEEMAMGVLKLIGEEMVGMVGEIPWANMEDLLRSICWF